MKKFFLSLAIVVAALCSQQLAAQTQINQASIASFPYFISQPGSYILTSNLTVPNTGSPIGIYVAASNVTINLNGYTISGPCPAGGCNSGSDGIYAPTGYTNTTVTNGQVTGFAYDVDIQSGDISQVKASNGNYCIFASNATIRHNVVSSCAEYGIYAQNSTISDNILSQNNYGGIYAFYSSINNNTAINNTYWGIIAIGGVVSGNTSLHNGTNNDLALGSNAVTTKTNACTAGAC